MPAACLIGHILQRLLTTSSCGFNHRKQTSPMGLEVSNEQALADAKSCQLRPTPIFLKYQNQEITRNLYAWGAWHTSFTKTNKTKNVSLGPMKAWWNNFRRVQNYFASTAKWRNQRNSIAMDRNMWLWEKTKAILLPAAFFVEIQTYPEDLKTHLGLLYLIFCVNLSVAMKDCGTDSNNIGT